MKLSKGDLQSIKWDRSYKDTKEKQNLIETLRWYDEQISKPLTVNFTSINTIKNFITLKTNNHPVEGPFFSEGWKKGWDQMVIAKKALVINDNAKNSTYNINNNLTWRYIGTSESGDLAQTILSIDSTGYSSPQTRAPYVKDVVKEGVYRRYMKFYMEGP